MFLLEHKCMWSMNKSEHVLKKLTLHMFLHFMTKFAPSMVITGVLENALYTLSKKVLYIPKQMERPRRQMKLSLHV